MNSTFDAVNERVPAGKLFTLGLQHVLVMYAGAIAVPLIVGRVLGLSPEDVAFLISAGLFVCGVVSIIQPYAAFFPVGGYRDHYSGYRRHTDANRHQLDIRPACRAHFTSNSGAGSDRMAQ